MLNEIYILRNNMIICAVQRRGDAAVLSLKEDVQARCEMLITSFIGQCGSARD